MSIMEKIEEVFTCWGRLEQIQFSLMHHQNELPAVHQTKSRPCLAAAPAARGPFLALACPSLEQGRAEAAARRSPARTRRRGTRAAFTRGEGETERGREGQSR